VRSKKYSFFIIIRVKKNALKGKRDYIILLKLLTIYLR